MAKQRKPRTPDESPISFNARDGQRIANAVVAHENSRRMPNPSVLPRASRGGGGGGVRIGQFAGAWPKDPGTSGTENVKTVMLYDKSTTNASPNAWQPSGVTVSAVNLFAYVPTPRGGPTSMWCAISLVSGTWILIAAEC
jgi:hypothetical protein